MLTTPRLDDLDYQRLWERARAMIPALTGEWTDLNDHDPGVTTLQAFAWLCDSLNYYINATGEAHRLNLLKLLGVRPRVSPAACRVEVRGETGAAFSLLPGARLLAGETVFELCEGISGRVNRMCRLYARSREGLLDLTPFVAEDGGYAPILSHGPGEEGAACFGFEAPLEGRVRLFLQVAETGRNPFGEDFSLVEPVWEYWDGEVWRGAKVLADETRGLLRGGFLTLELPGATALLEDGELAPAHYLRCRLARGCYDLPPRVGRVSPCCAQARQTDTAVRSVELCWNGEAALPIGFALGRGDRVAVAVEEEEGLWTRWREFAPGEDDLCAVEDGNVLFDQKRFGRLPQMGGRVLVTIARPGADLVLGETDGCASQAVELETRGLWRLRLALSRPGPEGRRVLELYDWSPDLEGAGCDDRLFTVEFGQNLAVFGDGVHGCEPEGGLLVEAAELVRSDFAGGNVLRGRVDRLEEPLDGLVISNLENASGGEERRAAGELEPLLEERFGGVTRAVTAGDIRALVLATPGLLIESAAVIPMKEYCAAAGISEVPANTVLVAVRPRSERPRPELGEDYARAIRRNLEQYRVLSTDLRVQSARYVGVGVYGRIRLAEPGPQGEQKVLEALGTWIEEEGRAAFGRPVDFGGIFSRLEMLPAVRQVEQLSLEYTGAGGGKNAHGDIVLLPDCLAYLWETGIEFA